MRYTSLGFLALAEGLSEDITTGLSKFSYLHVVSHNSTSRYKDQAVDIRQVGKELGARYIMEGGLRQAGTKVRINIQLLDTLTGTHLWAETFNRNLETADVFDVQDEITDRTVSTRELAELERRVAAGDSPRIEHAPH